MRRTGLALASVGAIVTMLSAACSGTPSRSGTSSTSSSAPMPTAGQTRSSMIAAPTGAPLDVGSLFPPASAVGTGYVIDGSPYVDQRLDSELVSQAYWSRGRGRIVGIDITFFGDDAVARRSASAAVGTPLAAGGRLGVGHVSALGRVRSVPAGVSQVAAFTLGGVSVVIGAGGRPDGRFPTAMLLALARVEASRLKSMGY